jgi:hypothetical protein
VDGKPIDQRAGDFARACAPARAHRALADCDQTPGDGDRSESDGDQTPAQSGRTAADQDQLASNRDLIRGTA